MAASAQEENEIKQYLAAAEAGQYDIANQLIELFQKRYENEPQTLRAVLESANENGQNAEELAKNYALKHDDAKAKKFIHTLSDIIADTYTDELDKAIQSKRESKEKSILPKAPLDEADYKQIEKLQAQNVDLGKIAPPAEIDLEDDEGGIEKFKHLTGIKKPWWQLNKSSSPDYVSKDAAKLGSYIDNKKVIQIREIINNKKMDLGQPLTTNGDTVFHLVAASKGKDKHEYTILTPLTILKPQYYYGNPELLLKALGAKNAQGKTAIQLARENGREYTAEQIEELIAETKSRIKHPLNNLEYFRFALKKADVSKSQEFIQAKEIALNTPLEKDTQKTALHFAAQYDISENAIIVQNLLNAGADAELPDRERKTPLGDACGNFSAARCIIEHLKQKYKDPAELIETLLRKAPEGKSAYADALSNGSVVGVQVAKLIEDTVKEVAQKIRIGLPENVCLGIRIEELFAELANERREIGKSLQKSLGRNEWKNLNYDMTKYGLTEWEQDYTGCKGYKVLLDAIKDKAAPIIVARSFWYEMNLDAKLTQEGESALHLVAGIKDETELYKEKYVSLVMLKSLLAGGANVDVLDDERNTPLMRGAAVGNKPFGIHLLAEIENRYARDPVKMLAVLLIKNKNEKTAEQLAREAGSADGAELANSIHKLISKLQKKLSVQQEEPHTPGLDNGGRKWIDDISDQKRKNTEAEL